MSEHPAFTLVENRYVKEFDTEARLYRHQKTGARVLSMVNTDDNKVFGITFKTPPDDSTGVAHILEHSVLCGSRKYPVKEPFKELMKSSLNTFMNAMTYSDKTVYPVASRNLKDFYNLVDVYLDAVFFPRLGRHVFEQEGWHYEHQDGQLQYKGVVYNEMKGVYSSPDSLLYEVAQQSLYPDTTYGHDSGGNPAHIPELTNEAFEDFHKRLYHPANSLVYFYGDDDPGERLDRLDAYLQEFDPAEGLKPIPLQPRFDAPRHVEQHYAGNEDLFVTTNWLLGSSTDLHMNLSMNLLAYILTGSPASPLRVALIESGLGEDVTGAGLDAQIREMYFSTGLRGVSEGDEEKVHDLIDATLRQICKDGFAPQMIEAAFNTVEFNLRENNTGSYPRGLVLMLRSLVTWLHDEDPIKPLEFEILLHEVRQACEKDPRYFEQLIQTWLLDNPHQTRLVLRPDPVLGAAEAAAETQRLSEARDAFNPEELEAITANAAHLESLQLTPDTEEALATMPSLHLSDVAKTVVPVPRIIDQVAQTDLIIHEQPTNGILYLDLGFNLYTLPSRLTSLVPLFARALTEMGTSDQTYIELNQRIASQTGGIEETFYSSGIYGATDTTAWMFLRSKVMASRLDDLFSILSDMLMKVKLDDRERFLHIVLEEKAGEESNLIPGGHGVVSTRMAARFSQAGWISEQLDGVTYLFFLRELVKRMESDWEGVKAELNEIRDSLLNRKHMICNLTATPPILEATRPKLESFLQALPIKTDASLHTWAPPTSHHLEGLEIPAKVQYVGRSIELFKLGYIYDASAMVINRHLRNNWLWDRVRVVGGAYGCFCTIGQKTGVMSFVSYRDPNIESTLDVYANAGQYLLDEPISEEELEREIIGMMGDLDPCQLPDAKGYGSLLRHLNGLSDELRQRMRDEVMSTSTTNFKVFGEMLASAGPPEHVAILGPRDRLEQVGTYLGAPLNMLTLL
ncbi:MAG: Zn-dependent M16 (insulinase) family peptidase [Kiritimatiellia bacterium]|jgi:Zn-dependent M16 (insulinase) family peptidase